MTFNSVVIVMTGFPKAFKLCELMPDASSHAQVKLSIKNRQRLCCRRHRSPQIGPLAAEAREARLQAHQYSISRPWVAASPSGNSPLTAWRQQK